jgi:hypothetical protein
VNVDGTRRVHEAVAAAGVPVLVHASAFGAYSGSAGDRRVDESWPTHGIPGSWYSRQKAEVERALDAFADNHRHVRIVRFRSALILKREAGAQAHRLYGGPLLSRGLVRPGRVPAVPDVPGVRVQAVHAADVPQLTRAYVRLRQLHVGRVETDASLSRRVSDAIGPDEQWVGVAGIPKSRRNAAVSPSCDPREGPHSGQRATRRCGGVAARPRRCRRVRARGGLCLGPHGGCRCPRF